MPENSGWWIFKVVKASDSCISQVAFRDDKNTVYVRICNNNTWGDWGKIAIGYPEFYKNYGTLSALATGLGVISSVSQYDSASYNSVDDFPHGITVIDHSHKTVTNNPFTSEVCVVITIIPQNVATTNSALQIAYRDSTVKYRARWVGSWGSWKEI